METKGKGGVSALDAALAARKRPKTYGTHTPRKYEKENALKLN